MSFPDAKIAPCNRRDAERKLRACRTLGIADCRELVHGAQDAVVLGDGKTALLALNALEQRMGGSRDVDPERAPRMVQAPGGPERCERCGRTSDEMMSAGDGGLVCDDCVPRERFEVTAAGSAALEDAYATRR